MKLNKIEIAMGAVLAFVVILVTLIVINTKQSNIKYEKTMSSIKGEAYKISDSVALSNMVATSSNIKAVQQEQASGKITEGVASEIAKQEQAKVEAAEKAKQAAMNSTKVEKGSTSYRGLSTNEIGRKINTLLGKSTLAGKGTVFAKKSLELGLDPYLATAVMLHETGCAWKCSNLVRTKYNLGGLKGSNGSYRKFNSLDEGIEGYLNILYNNYYSKGLTTPEKMARKYTGQKNPSAWISKVNSYITKLKKA